MNIDYEGEITLGVDVSIVGDDAHTTYQFRMCGRWMDLDEICQHATPTEVYRLIKQAEFEREIS